MGLDAPSDADRVEIFGGARNIHAQAFHATEFLPTFPMPPTFIRRLGLFAVALASVGFARAAEPPIVAKARAYLGSEAALNAIKSVHFKGTVTTTDPAAADKPTTASIEIIVQKPDQQRVVASTSKGTETTAVDGYEGWQRFQDSTNLKNVRLIVLKPEAVKRQRAQAFENLSFFRGLEQHGGQIEDQGTATIDGVTCQKVAFIHTPKIVFVRYFDVTTGRLVRTDTDDGGTSSEQGEQRVAGVRFPKAMKMTVKNAKGATQHVSIVFESIQVNETFPDAVFRMPSPSAP
jgi:outer membrane lipoprotein-sorting protein